MRKDKKIFITFILVLIISIFLSYLFFINGSTNKLFGNANDFIASIDDEENLNSYPIIKMFFNSSGEKKVNDDVVLTLDAESRYNINKVEYSFDLKNWKVLNKKYDKKNITAKIIFNNDMNKEVYVRVINEQDYDMEILTYDNNGSGYTDDEIEAFIIADDIIKRMNSGEKTITFENDQMVLKDMTYDDFVILVDKGKNFDLLKKVLEYKGIPATIDKDTSIKDEDEIYILKNIIKLILCIRNKKLNVDFKHAFISVARSYVVRYDDAYIYELFSNNSFNESTLYKTAEEIALIVDTLSIKEILMMCISKFDIIDKLNSVASINERLTKLEYFVNNATNLNNFGYSIDNLVDYFDEV